jgi:hypothetical protein
MGWVCRAHVEIISCEILREGKGRCLSRDKW